MRSGRGHSGGCISGPISRGISGPGSGCGRGDSGWRISGPGGGGISGPGSGLPGLPLGHSDSVLLLPGQGVPYGVLPVGHAHG